ncbi:TauD/TfdA family dioxygenase [Phenylobacterium sp.]|uniref:TauD/TfdA dioxygenase family protein n=1 Tax=Phenylobacterium sp. TaxID=1871053 RepID=UPI0025D64032|nr:TauD/TfdA family dioxygenase [Phenylobacterium sp.]
MIIHPTGKFDNHARDYAHIEALPLAAAMGAEIRGVNLSAVSDAQFAEVRDALFRHKMIYFRDQRISHGDQEAFSRRFGPFAPDAYTQGVPGHPDVQPLIKEADARAGMVFGAGWHTDSPFLPQPPAISMLYGVDIPPYGGDTLWANAALAYALLSDTMKTMLAPLKVRMSMRRVLATAQAHQAPDDSILGRVAATRDLPQLPQDIVRKVEGSAHPLVRTHPVTGDRSLYCDGTYALGLEGLTPAEAEPLLGFLVAHITQPAFTCRLRWAPGTFALWDNRLCLHQAFNDYDGFRRELYRTTIAGETPA